jgi:hypothetical protein
MVNFRTAGTGLYFCWGLKMTKSTTATVAKALFGITRVSQNTFLLNLWRCFQTVSGRRSVKLHVDRSEYIEQQHKTRLETVTLRGSSN